MVTWSKIITQQRKAIENPNIIDIKSVTIENPKTSCKWSNTIRHAEKVFQGPPLHSPLPPPTPHPQKKAEKKTILNAKITKQYQAHKGYPSNYNVEILNSFNAKLQFKDIDSKITIKLKHLVTQSKGFKFMTTLLLEFKKIESDDETKYSTF